MTGVQTCALPIFKDRKEICDDFKAVYQANSKEEANTFLSGMIEKWKKNYPKVTQSLIENQDLLTFYDLDRKSTRLNSSHLRESRMPSSA